MLEAGAEHSPNLLPVCIFLLTGFNASEKHLLRLWSQTVRGPLVNVVVSTCEEERCQQQQKS